MARTKAFDQEKVLEKALHIFWRDGYDATSMSKLVKELGISRSSIYDTFGDKRALFLASLNAYRQQSSEMLIKTLKVHPDPKRALHEMLETAMRQTAKDPERKGCFMANTSVELSSYDQEILDLSKENKERVIDAFTQAIRRGQRTGDISKKFPATQLAEFIYAAYNGLQVVGKFDPDLKKLKQTVKIALSVLEE
ncbi:MAG: TetR/AcrR family transcriptional regulator [Bacteroidota bacterium]